MAEELDAWMRAFASCSIEGNKLAIYMIEIYNNDKKKYLEELEKFLNYKRVENEN